MAAWTVRTDTINQQLVRQCPCMLAKNRSYTQDSQVGSWNWGAGSQEKVGLEWAGREGTLSQS